MSIKRIIKLSFNQKILNFVFSFVSEHSTCPGKFLENQPLFKNIQKRVGGMVNTQQDTRNECNGVGLGSEKNEKRSG